MIWLVLIVCMAVCALVPACLFFVNVTKFRAPIKAAAEALPHVSVLIPARNEEDNIGEA